MYSVDIIGAMPTRKSKDDGEKSKSEGVYIRLSPKEKEAMETAASHDERTLADWVRRLARHKVRDLGLLPELEKKPTKKQ